MATENGPAGNRSSWPLPLDDDHAVALLRRMVEIPSPSGAEGDLAMFLGVVMTELGYQVTRDVAGNVVGSLGPAHAPEIMLLGHMDTVDGELPVDLDPVRLTGRGTVDAKSPLAAMIMAGARYGARQPRSRITVIGVVEEETPGSKGAVNVRLTRSAPAALFVGEPSGWGGLVVGYKGKLDLKVTARVAAAHPTAPVLKATERVAAAWQEFLEVIGPDRDHARFDAPGVNLTYVRGDEAHCEAEFSVRTPPGYDLARVAAEMIRRLPDLTLEITGSVPAIQVDPLNAPCRALRAAIRDAGGRPVLKKKTATSDMNILAETWHCPMVTYGPGDSRLDHSDHEHITLTEFTTGLGVLTQALAVLADETATEPAGPAGHPYLHMVPPGPAPAKEHP